MKISKGNGNWKLLHTRAIGAQNMGIGYSFDGLTIKRIVGDKLVFPRELDEEKTQFHRLWNISQSGW